MFDFLHSLFRAACAVVAAVEAAIAFCAAFVEFRAAFA